jgi:EmrB/QacA subfamily drug resistance transporter
MLSLMLCMFLSALDGSIVSTATPRILADLGGFSLLSWVFTVYILSSTVVVPIVGKLSDMFGRKTFLIGGIAIFVIASAACGAAPSMIVLIVARGVQGFGGGMVMASVFTTLGDLFPPAERAKYIGLFTGTFSLAAITGPTVGGLLTDSVGWRWCFFVNVPFGALAILFIWLNLPFRRLGGKLARVDFAGAALLASATTSLLLALVWGHQQFGWASPETVGLFVAAGVLTVAFVLQEMRHPEAILPMALFRNRVFVQSNLMVVFLGAGMFGAIQYLPTFLQTALGNSATSSGLISTPQSLGLLVSSVIGGQIIARTGRFKYQVILGACFVVAASFLLRTLDTGEAEWHISLFMVLYGLGSGLVMPSLSVVVQSAVSHEYLGVATSSRQFFMQIGQVFGTAIFGVILATSFQSSFDSHVSEQARAAIAPATLQRFEDPTLALDKRAFAQVQTEVRALPGGEVLLASTVAAQKDAIATAMRDIFTASSVAALLVLFLAVTAKEIPLRRGFFPTQAPAARPVPAGGPLPAAAPEAAAMEPPLPAVD